jgi:hypothetical protein
MEGTVRRAEPAAGWAKGPRECPREDELLEALQTSAWPDTCPRELHAHVEGCQACAGLVAVVLPLLDEHRVATAAAPVPSSGMVWWRAQMRARQEAARAAAQPISIVQAIGIACAIGLLAGGLTVLSPSVGPWFAWMGNLADALPSMPTVEWSSIQGMAPLTLTVLLALMTVLILAPVALYLSQSE